MINLRIPVLLVLVFILSTISCADSSCVNDGNFTQIKSNSQIAYAEGKSSKLPIWAGFIGCLVASLFFGSNLLPVKHFSAGDGFFFQFINCVASWVVGLVLDRILNNQRFYPFVLVGGVLWTTGNLVTVFCIKTIGLSVGVLIWGTTSLIVGWAGGRFGLFGINAHVPSSTSKLIMNYLSVVLAAISGIFFLFITSNVAPSAAPSHEQYSNREMEVSATDIRSQLDQHSLENDFPFLTRMNERTKKIIGFTLAALSGVFYGLMFIPDQYIRSHPYNYTVNGMPPSDNGLDYINSQYSGILLSSLFYFAVYAAVKRNKPSINPVIVLPAIACGLMWGIANIGFIVAISALSSAVAYPIVNVLPGIVSSLWSLFLFREIEGKRNYILLGFGMLTRLIAAILSGLSGT